MSLTHLYKEAWLRAKNNPDRGEVKKHLEKCLIYLDKNLSSLKEIDEKRERDGIYITQRTDKTTWGDDDWPNALFFESHQDVVHPKGSYYGLFFRKKSQIETDKKVPLPDLRPLWKRSS